MKRMIFSATLIIYAAISHAQQTLPAAVAVPAGSTLLLHVYAKGVQIYRCTQDPKDTSNYIWRFQEPKATLYTDAKYKHKTGDHYLSAAKSPTWQLSDGAIVSGAKLQAATPDSLSIPWLLLKAVPQSGKGSFTTVNFIQRLTTNGGLAPSVASKAQKGQLLQVPYTAEYLFYQ